MPHASAKRVGSLKTKLEAFQRSRVGLFVKKATDDQAPNLAALLAWGTLNAILPLVLGVLAVAGLVLRDPQTLDKVYSTLLSVLPSAVAGPITSVLDSMRQGSAAPAGIVAILLLLVNGANFYTNMASVFDQAFHVQPRNFLVERLIAFGMLLVTAVLIVVSTLAAGMSGLVTNLPGILPIGPVLAQVIGWSVSILSVVLFFVLIYRVLPNVQQSWHDVLPGALVATFLALLISQVFPLYLALFPPNHAYAVFGVILVFTFWLYLVGLSFVLGAELNAFMQQPARSLALAEATAAAQRGQAEYEPAGQRIKAEASGQAPSLQGGGALGVQPRSTSEQIADEPQSVSGDQRPRAGVGGRGSVLGFVGLIVAALLLRGAAKDQHVIA